MQHSQRFNVKEFRDVRRGRINGIAEHRQHLILRSNLEKVLFTKTQAIIRKLANTQTFLYRQFGIFEPMAAARLMTEELFPLVSSHYKRVFLSVFSLNNRHYDSERKQEALIFGQSVDIERLVAEFFATRQLLLSNISLRLARDIDGVIQRGRADGLTLTQIAKNIKDKFVVIGTSRAALIARTETHNSASYANHIYHGAIQADLSIKMMKTWVSTSDARTRPEHSAANKQTVEMDEPFILGHPKLGSVEMQYVSDPAGGVYHAVNCRCVVVYADERDVVTA